MPISREQFDSGERDVGFLIIEFLRSNPDYAYTLQALVVQLASQKVNIKTREMQDILGLLEKEGKIEAKVKQGVVYYIYLKPRLGFRL